MSRVDVIVPCYKYAHYLRECVESVFSQEGLDVRVLIIDDCSPDNTPEVAAELMSQDSRIEYRRHEKNWGHIATYNEGLEWASGDYLLLLSADDLLYPEALLRAATLMDKHPEVGLTHGRSTSSFQSEAGPTSTDQPWEVSSGLEYIRAVCRTGENIVSTPTAIVRTSIQKKLGGYRKELPHAGDMEMWLRFAAVSSMASTQAIQACYRMHGQNMSDDFYKSQGDLLQRRDVFLCFFQDFKDQLPDTSGLKTQALRSLSREAMWKAHKPFESRDPSTCQRWLDLSVEIDPSIRNTKEWKRFRIRRLMGPRAWTRIKPLMKFIRGAWKSSHCANQTAPLG